MKKQLTTALLLSLCLWTEGFAQDVNSGNFVASSTCKNGDALSCIAWVAGTLSGFSVQSAIDEKAILYCAPHGVTLGQQKDVFLKYIRDNPQELHEDAAMLLYFSQMKAFPCPKIPTGN